MCWAEETTRAKALGQAGQECLGSSMRPAELKQSEGGEQASEMRSWPAGRQMTHSFETLRLAFTLRGKATEGLSKGEPQADF